MTQKQVKKDFNESMLPSTRRKQFSDIFKNNFKKVALVGLFIALFAFPLLVSHLVTTGYLPLLYNEAINKGNSQNDANLICVSMYFFASLVNILFYALLGVGVSGSVRILRNLVFNEGILVKDDFFKGVKLYWKPYVFIFVFFGVIVSTFNGLNFLFYFNNTVQIMLVVFKVIFTVTIMPILFIYLSLSIFYEDTKTNRLVTSTKIYIAYFLKYLAFIPWLPLIYIFVPLIGQIAVRLLVEILIFMVAMPFFMLTFHLFMVSIFDEVINKKQYPEIYRKGLSNKEDTKNE